ncbi:MAG: hypothetical protein ACLFQR_05795 [Desulfovibrionales bacterium]
MGKYLQIRLTASTYRPEDVLKAWPKLAAGAWPMGTENVSRTGVLELVDALLDQYRFGELDQHCKRELKDAGIERLAYLKTQLDKALGDWNAGKANETSNTIEETLDELEQTCKWA